MSRKYKIFTFLALIAGLGLFFTYYSTNRVKPLHSPCSDELSLETCHKIGQMLIIGFGGLAQDAQGKIIWQDPDHLDFHENAMVSKNIKNHYVGGVILFTRAFRQNTTGKFIRDYNIRHPTQVTKLIQDLQNYTSKLRKNEHLPELPLFVSIDQEGGLINRLPFELGFDMGNLIPQALGANQERVAENSVSIETVLGQTRAYADEMAVTLKQLGFNLNFAPCVDVNINPINPILGGLGRSFSWNPEIVANQAWEFVQAFNEHHIIAALKHFPGHGSSVDDTHLGLVDVTNTYQQNELLPYQMLIQKGYQDIIMTTHVINGQLDRTQCKLGAATDSKTFCPGTLSYNTLAVLLREKLKFEGVVISDDMMMGAIAQEYPLEIAIEKAIHAGVDMFIISNNNADYTELVFNTIVKLVKEGKITEDRLNTSYERIIKLKKRLRLFN